MAEHIADDALEALADLLAQARAVRIVAAFSGGLDSSVLLHLLHRFSREAGVELLAAHVNHGISADAAQWQRHCEAAARTLGVAFTALPVALPHGASMEAIAREHRYRALKTLLDAQTVLCTAHHRNDQAETLLLNLLRGTGPAGLAAMPKLARFGPGWIARPLLGFTRTALRAYAGEAGIRWVDDDSNDDLRHSRNYLRHRIAPVIAARWGAWDATLARAAEHQAQVRTLAAGEGGRWLGRCLTGGGLLSRKACRALPAECRSLVLRAWIASHGLAVPGERKLRVLWDELIGADARNGAAVSWPDMEFRFYRGLLYLIGLPRMAPPRRRIEWRRGRDLELPEIGMKLHWRDLVRQAPDLREADLNLRFRAGSEHCGYDGGRFHRSLKKLFQQCGVPPWERGRVPLVYAGDKLRVVWNVASCD